MVYLIRHTQPAVPEDVCYGSQDVPLAPSSAEDITNALAVIPTVAAVFTSPALRCRQLAESVCARDSALLQVDARLSELDFGAWEGARWADLPRAEIDAWANDWFGYAPGGGETARQLWDRVAACRAAALAPLSAEPLLVVGHHGSLRALLAQARNLPIERMLDHRFAYGAAGLTTLERV
jgi:alpha-ribazole phosphatase